MNSLSDSGTFQMVVKGIPGTEMVVEGTEDFLEWTPISTHTSGPLETLTFSELASANLRARFFRARVIQ